MPKWRSGGVAKWLNGKVAQWRSEWRNGEVVKWRSEWRSGEVAKWRSEWRSGGVAKWPNGEVAKWRRSGGLAVAAQLKTPDFVPKLWWTPKKFQNFEKMIPKNYSKKVEKNFELAWVGLSIAQSSQIRGCRQHQSDAHRTTV